jgi:hypothetical protein
MTQPNIWPPVEAMVVLRKSDREELLVIERPRHSNGQMFVVQRGGTWNYEWSRVSLDELMPDDRKERIDRGAALFAICDGLTLEQVAAAIDEYRRPTP